MGEFGIGRMAELNCVSEKALRLYHQKGLLNPVRIDEATGYRYYSYEQCSTVDMIQQLQSVGASLDDIKRLLDGRDPSKLAEMLEVRLASIDAELRQLGMARQNALQLLESYRVFQDRPLCNQVILEHIAERKLVTFGIFNSRSLRLVDDTESFLQEWEINLRLTKRHMRDAGMPLSLFHRVGCRIARADLVRRDFRLDASFVFLDDETAGMVEGVETLPAGTFLTLYKARYTDENGLNAEMVGLSEMLDFAEERGFEVAGDYYGEIVAETPAFLYEGREMLFKLQIPVVLAH